MEEYIKKSEVIAEIKKRLKHNGTRAELDRSAFMAGREKEDEDILTFLDTLEVKEVDLEKDVDAILETNDWNYDKIDFYEFAKHFFELGLEIQKGE